MATKAPQEDRVMDGKLLARFGDGDRDDPERGRADRPGVAGVLRGAAAASPAEARARSDRAQRRAFPAGATRLPSGPRTPGPRPPQPSGGSLKAAFRTSAPRGGPRAACRLPAAGAKMGISRYRRSWRVSQDNLVGQGARRSRRFLRGPIRERRQRCWMARL